MQAYSNPNATGTDRKWSDNVRIPFSGTNGQDGMTL